MQKSIRFFAVIFISTLMLFLVPSNIQYADAFRIDVKVTVKELEALDVIDTLDGADFFPEITIDGGTPFGNVNMQILDDDNPQPGWVFTKGVDLSKGNIPIVIKIFDDDDTFNGDVDHIDLDPNGSDRNLEISLNLKPCSISGDVSGDCKVTLDSSGAENDSAKIDFSIEVVVSEDGPGLNAYCLHSPIWPQAGEDITIIAVALDDDLKPKVVDNIQIIVTTDPMPAVSVDDDFVATATVDPSEVDFMYNCQVEENGQFEDTGFRELDVGTETGERAISILSTKDVDDSPDIVFIPDQDDYSSADDDAFLKDVENSVEAYFTGGLVFLDTQDSINFWLSQDDGNAVSFTNGKCDHVEPGNWSMDFAFANTGVILHNNSPDPPVEFRNCASSGFASANINNPDPKIRNVLVHELGHQPFGLADEYCNTRSGSESTKCDGGYFQTNDAPNVFNSTAFCENDPNRNGKPCDEFVSQNSKTMGKHFFTYDPVKDDLMVDNQLPEFLDIRRILHVFSECMAGRC